MPKVCVRRHYWHGALIAVIALAVAAGYAVPQDNPSVDSGGRSHARCGSLE